MRDRKQKSGKRTQRPLQQIKYGWPSNKLLAILALFCVAIVAGCTGIASANNSKKHSLSNGSVQVTPTSLNFGTTTVGKKMAQNISVTNAGSASVNITQASVSNSQFSVSGLSMPLALPANQSTSFQVWFDASTKGNAKGTLMLQTDAGISAGPVNLAGMVNAPPQQISVTPTSLNLGSTTVGTTINSTVTISNLGGSNLTVSLVSVDPGPFGVSGVATPLTITPGGAAPMNVSYSPTSAGTATGSITITSNDLQNPTSVVSLSGTATTATVAPSITTQPGSQTVTAGQTATFSVVAGGTAPLTYQWRKNGGNISGATAASYTTPATTTSDSGSTFAVVVNNSAGTATSASATLTVNAAGVPPSITTQPGSQTVTAGQTATFSVVATGTTPMTYQWQKNGANISGATAASYTTPATTTSDSGSTFAVVVNNSAGTATSTAATLTVNAAAVPPSITTQPGSQTVTAGQTATFSVVAGGTAPLTYQWRKNGGNISGATAASYTTPATTTSDSGSTFSVVVNNTAGTATSASATLTVNAAAVAPSITTQPGSQTVTAGQTATFSVVATGTTPMTYQWQKNSANISGATAASYTTPATTTSDSGATFSVVVNNTAGTATSTAATLTVNAAPTPAIQLSTTSINFGSVVVNSNLSQTLIITNTGNATLTITQLTASAAGFSVSGFSLPLNINAGQRTTINAVFVPASAGSVSGGITIVSNAPTSPSTVNLTGTGIAATFTLGINPTSLSFGSITTGTSSAAQNVTITNTGNSSVTISQITASGAGFLLGGGSTPVTLSPAQNLTLSAQFSPTASGTVNGSISIVSNATGSPATVSLSGTGVTSVQHSAALNWNASTSTVSGYNVYRSTVSGSSYIKINSSLVAGLTYTDTSVVSGTTYYYVTTAVDSSGNESTFSNEVSAPIP